MKNFTFLVVAAIASFAGYAQTDYKITWGEEMKLKKGTADLDILLADNTGLYFSQERKAGMQCLF